jgi:hypothetical protein
VAKRDTVQQRKKDANQAAFLAAFRETGNVSLSAAAAGIERTTHYKWLDDDGYRARFDLAQDDAVDVLEAEARRRAVEGVDEPVGWYQGVAGGTVRKYSDTLLIFLMKGAAPHKYRERHDVEHSGSIGTPELTVVVKRREAET